MLKIELTEDRKKYALGQQNINHEISPFLQSFEYGEMQNELGIIPFRMLICDEKDNIKGSYTAFLTSAKRGKYFTLPYIELDAVCFDAVLKFLKEVSVKEKVDFIRVSPLALDNDSNKLFFAERGFRNAPVHMMHPELLWLLDLSISEKELMKNMRKNTRYAIKQAEKKGIEIVSGNSEDLLDAFYDIHMDTAQRQHFVPFSKDYLANELKFFSDDEVNIYLAKYEDMFIAGAIIVYYGGEGVYHHGASLAEYNKIPGSYLIQWEAIKEAKKRGMSRYNFWGIVENAPKHPWAGLSFFKQGFGGQGVELLHCQDLPLRWKYWFNFIVETLRRIKRGY